MFLVKMYIEPSLLKHDLENDLSSVGFREIKQPKYFVHVMTDTLSNNYVSQFKSITYSLQ